MRTIGQLHQLLTELLQTHPDAVDRDAAGVLAGYDEDDALDAAIERLTQSKFAVADIVLNAEDTLEQLLAYLAGAAAYSRSEREAWREDILPLRGALQEWKNASNHFLCESTRVLRVPAQPV